MLTFHDDDLSRYDHDHVGNRAERVKIVECYGRSKVQMLLRGQAASSYLPLRWCFYAYCTITR